MFCKGRTLALYLLFNIFINDLSVIFSNKHFLLYPDDLKVFCRVSDLHDAHNMQLDLMRFERCCAKNEMMPNLSKCIVMRAPQSSCCIMYPYELHGVVLRQAMEVTDLVVSISSCFDFWNHYTNITSKAVRTLSLVKRFLAHFQNRTKTSIHFPC